jgi:hypothetical protein
MEKGNQAKAEKSEKIRDKNVCCVPGNVFLKPFISISQDAFVDDFF